MPDKKEILDAIIATIQELLKQEGDRQFKRGVDRGKFEARELSGYKTLVAGRYV